jgi:hypothetical protein
MAHAQAVDRRLSALVSIGSTFARPFDAQPRRDLPDRDGPLRRSLCGGGRIADVIAVPVRMEASHLPTVGSATAG